jgi:hypothetical protein
MRPSSAAPSPILHGARHALADSRRFRSGKGAALALFSAYGDSFRLAQTLHIPARFIAVAWHADGPEIFHAVIATVRQCLDVIYFVLPDAEFHSADRTAAVLPEMDFGAEFGYGVGGGLFSLLFQLKFKMLKAADDMSAMRALVFTHWIAPERR